MNENLLQTEYDLSKKSKIKNFYEKNRIKIFLFITILIICIIASTFYLENKKNKKIILSENYINAKIYLENNEKDKARKILENIILESDSTYSALSLFLILNENLIEDKSKISALFDYILEKSKFEKEIKNLIILKKALFLSNSISEKELLDSLKPLLGNESLWKPHALLLIADYYLSKKENIKAREFYLEILKLKNLSNEFYDKSRTHLTFIANE